MLERGKYFGYDLDTEGLRRFDCDQYSLFMHADLGAWCNARRSDQSNFTGYHWNGQSGCWRWSTRIRANFILDYQGCPAAGCKRVNSDKGVDPKQLPRLIQIQVAISIIAILVLLGVVFQLGPLIERKAELELQVEEKLDEYRQARNKLDLAEERLREIYDPPLSEIEVLASKSESSEEFTTPLGSQFYNFSLWLKTPGLLSEKIEKVEYYFDNPTFRVKRMESSDQSSAFAVSYLGYSCLTNVLVTVFFKDQTTREIDFEFCEHLAPDDIPT